MKTLLWAAALSLAAVGLVMLASFFPGQVVVFVPPYRIDMSSHLFFLLYLASLVMAAVSFQVVHLIVKKIKQLRSSE